MPTSREPGFSLLLQSVPESDPTQLMCSIAHETGPALDILLHLKLFPVVAIVLRSLNEKVELIFSSD